MNKSLAVTSMPLAAAPPIEALVQTSALRWVVAIVLGSAALAIASQLSIPLQPVPMTMQTYAVIMIGALCGWRLAALTVLAYLVEGAAGLPVFADGAAGLAKMIGTTGGYLIGFLPAAALIGYLADRGWNNVAWKLAASLLVGHLVVFAFGVSYLASFTGVEKAIALGFVPFILGTVLKTALAFFSVYGIRRFTKA